MDKVGNAEFFTCSGCGEQRKFGDAQVCVKCGIVPLCRDCWQAHHAGHDMRNGAEAVCGND